MTEFWKSNPKKFCEMCQCWMADNKISVQNHENGMRHKANVEKKVNDLTRSNRNGIAEKKKFEQSIQKINDKAHVSMMKDIERDPKLAKRYDEHLVEKKNDETQKRDAKTNNPITNLKPQIIWRESITSDGTHYYWNSVTRETQWNRPDGTIELGNAPVKQEKGRLQQFVFQRLVELSELGAEGANEAVLKSFNISVSETEPQIPKKETNRTETETETIINDNSEKFQGPKIDLLGQWVTCDDDVPKPKILKLDLPEKVLPSNSNDPIANEKLAAISHLEKTAEQNLWSASHLEPSEKVIAPGSVNQRFRQKTTTVKMESDTQNTPQVVFKRRSNLQSNRNLRTTSLND